MEFGAISFHSFFSKDQISGVKTAVSSLNGCPVSIPPATKVSPLGRTTALRKVRGQCNPLPAGVTVTPSPVLFNLMMNALADAFLPYSLLHLSNLVSHRFGCVNGLRFSSSQLLLKYSYCAAPPAVRI